MERWSFHFLCIKGQTWRVSFLISILFILPFFYCPVIHVGFKNLNVRKESSAMPNLYSCILSVLRNDKLTSQFHLHLYSSPTKNQMLMQKITYKYPFPLQFFPYTDNFLFPVKTSQSQLHFLSQRQRPHSRHYSLLTVQVDIWYFQGLQCIS